MSVGQTIRLYPEAPPKPEWGAPCNGCGVCCLSEPCPLGRLVTLHWRGPCRLLRWDEAGARYRCGLAGARLLRPLVLRWIAADWGCDSDAQVLPGRT